MKLLLTIFSLIISSQAIAVENLKLTDLHGIWISNYSPVKGEVQRLIIKEDLSTYFERSFNNVNQEFNAEPTAFLQYEDVIILRYNIPNKGLRYKLVLSGWHTKSTYALYGTMFMYKEGKQFNGLPVSFRKQK